MAFRGKVFALILLIVSVPALPAFASSSDWPMWRCDAQHTASSPQELPKDLHLQWVLELPTPRACWPPTQHKLLFDLSYEPVVMGDTLFVPSMVRDSVTAYDTETGEEKWRYYTGGPVRFAPLAWNGKVYFVSDDGYLYCLDAAKGTLLWKFRGGPSERRLLGNERLISMWPARGAPVLEDGTVYFGASIWPFMGTFIHALDAETGAVVWTNSGSGSDFIAQPHNSPAFAGVAPQGYLGVAGDKLLVASGRSVPAVYDRKTGEFLHFQTATKLGGYAFFVAEPWFLNDGYMYKIEDGSRAAGTNASVVADGMMIGVSEEGGIRACSLDLVWEEYLDKRGEKQKRPKTQTLWEIQGKPAVEKVFIKAGSRLYAGRKDGLIAAIDLPFMLSSSPKTPPEAQPAAVSWQTTIEGTPWSMLAADGKLFVVTQEGRIYCFGGKATEVKIHTRATAAKPRSDETWARTTKQVLEATGVRDGYCLVLGVGTGQLVEELARQSDLQVIGFDPDAEKVNALRRRFDEAGLYGERIALHAGDILSVPISPYLASLVVSEDLQAAGYGRDDAFIRRVFHLLRPYGGVACFGLAGEAQDAFVNQVEAADLQDAAPKGAGDYALLERAGPLPGSAEWTHAYGDVANTVCSKDTLVKPPLALLWFGGPSHVDVLPRHGHGPSEQVVGGRLFIEGIGVISARDVYTGRVLWRRELPYLNTFGMYYDQTFDPDPYDRSYNQVHIPGANAYGTNFVATADKVYVIQGRTWYSGIRSCLVLDAATGETLREITLPSKPGIEVPNWGYVGVYEDLLIAGAAPLEVSERDGKVVVEPNRRFATGSRYLVVMDRHSGEVLWEREAAYNFRHNTIIAAKDRLFCIDGMSRARMDLMKRRGMEVQAKPRILALDIRTGKEIWSVEDNVTGTWLGYSEEYDILLQAGSRARDRARDETGEGMSAYRGADGTLLWHSDRAYSGPCILHHDKIITQPVGSSRYSIPAQAFGLLTGEVVTQEHPLTGETIPWAWIRMYGCNTAIGSEHLLTFRSASAAYADLSAVHGVTSIGGFKSGCSSSLVVADGVLNAPDYTRTCTCSYQNQTSLALFHMPSDDPGSADVEGWSLDHFPAPEKPTPIRRVGINFGAPGNRLADTGTLWLEAPSVGGPSPEIPICVESDRPRVFRYHMSRVEKSAGADAQGALNWVAASGIEGVTAITLRPFLQPGEPDPDGKVPGFDRNAGTSQLPDKPYQALGSHDTPWSYTVRLHFAEMEQVRPGERVFDVFIQGEKVLEDFDIVEAAGDARRAVVKEFSGIPVTADLSIAMRPSPGGTTRPPLLCGIELVAEE